jgi:hypothetical protein
MFGRATPNRRASGAAAAAVARIAVGRAESGGPGTCGILQEKRRFPFALRRSKLFLLKQLDGVETAMVSSVLVLLLAVSATQTDTTRTSREAYTRCLRAFMTRSVASQMAVDAFKTALATACAAEKTAFHNAVVQRENASRATRATAERTATEAVDEATTNFRELYADAMTPQ